MEELNIIKCSLQGFGLTSVRKKSFEELLEAIDNAVWDNEKQTSLEGRVTQVVSSYVHLVDALGTDAIEYGPDNPFDLPKNRATEWRGSLLQMEHRIATLNRVIERRERIKKGKPLNLRPVTGKGAKQNKRIREGFVRLYTRAKQNKSWGVEKSEVLELAALYAVIRDEGLGMSHFRKLDELLATEKGDWKDVVSELQYLERLESLEELNPMSFDWKVFDSSLAVARKDDFQRLLKAIDIAVSDNEQRTSFARRASAVFTQYVGFFDSLEICAIEYGTDNPFNIPENLAGVWGDILKKMEQRIKVLSGIVERRERASTGKALNSLELKGEDGEQHDRILKLFAALYVRAEHGEIYGVSAKQVEELVQLYAEIRLERPEASEYERLEEILLGKEMEWFELNEELGYLEIPETRPTVTEWDAAWEVSRAVVQTLRANEVSKEELVEKLKLDPVVVERRKMIAEWDEEIEVPELEGEEAAQDLRILDGFDRLYAGGQKEEVAELELLYVALRTEWYDVRRFASLEQLMVAEKIDWAAVVQEMEYLELPASRPHEGDHIHLQGLGWFISRLFKSEEIDLDQALNDVYRLGDGKLTWGEFLKEGGPLLWKAMKDDSGESFDWGALKGATEYPKNDMDPNSIGWRHAAWVVTQLSSKEPLTWEQFQQKIGYEGDDQAEYTGLEAAWLVSELLDSEEISWEQVQEKLLFLANPENRTKINWTGVCVKGVVLLRHAMETGETQGVVWRDVKEALGEPNEVQISWGEAGALALNAFRGKEITWGEANKAIATLAHFEDRESITIKQLAWFAARTLGSEEIDLDQAEEDLKRLNSNKLTWGQILKESRPLIWNAIKGRSSEGTGVTWRDLEKVVGTKQPYDGNDEVVSAKHMVWLGIKLFESDEVSFEKFDQHLTEIVDPENRAQIGWGQVAKMGVKALWRAMVGSPSKNEEKEEELIMLEPLTKKFPSLKAKLRSIDGVLVAKLAIGLVALVGIGVIAYNFEAIRNAFTGGHSVGGAPPVVTPPPPVVTPPPPPPVVTPPPPPPVVTPPPPPPVVTPPPPPASPAHTQGLHFHNGVWTWG